MPKAAGHIIIASPDAPLHEVDTLQCVHCNAHFEMNRGSGKKRGWCTRCCGPTCGGQACARCVPFEKKLEAIERRARNRN